MKNAAAVLSLSVVVGMSLLLAGCGVSSGNASAAGQPATGSTSPQPTGQKVTFKRGDLTLEGFLFKPDGPGPFPAIIWNHGSEQYPDKGPEFPSIAQIFVPAGYVVFAPVREGHGESQGQYIQDQFQAEAQKNGAVAAHQLFVQLMEGPQLDDQLAGLDYLKGQSYVDTNRLAVVGCSYGGIETLFAAEKGAGFKAAVAESPGAESWDANLALQQRLLTAVDNINIPVFLLHPQKDASVSPGYTLGQEFQKLGKPYQLEIYAPYGSTDQQGHCFGGAAGFQTWAPEVLRFLKYFVH